MSTPAPRRADTVAGFLAAFSLALSAVALVRQPALLASAAILVALLAARMSDGHRRLAALAVTIGVLAFVVGMAIAVWAETPLL